MTKVNLIKELVALELDGINSEYLETLSIEQLTILHENTKTLKNTKTKKIRSNVSLEVVNNCLDNEVQTLSKKELNTLVRSFNLANYFNTPESYTFISVARTNSDALLNVIQSNKDDKTNSERLNDWLDRSQNYINSHIIGKTIKGNLFANKDSEHYFTFKDGVYNLIEKVKA